MKDVYLAAALLGAVVPYLFFTRFLLSPDPTLGAFTGQLFATAPAGGFTSDLFITSCVFWIWSHDEARRQGMKGWWGYVVATLAVGLSFALPLFLYMRERREERSQTA